MERDKLINKLPNVYQILQLFDPTLEIESYKKKVKYLVKSEKVLSIKNLLLALNTFQYYLSNSKKENISPSLKHCRLTLGKGTYEMLENSIKVYLKEVNKIGKWI